MAAHTVETHNGDKVLPGPLYPISDASNRLGLGHVQMAAAFLEAGIRFFQVRDKISSDRSLLDQLRQIRRLCRRCRASFVVNDRADLALASGASGVHLGQEDLPAREARKILGPQAVIGLSTHSLEQLEEALSLPIDYLALGPLFATSTKEGCGAGLGLELLKQASARTRVHLVAIGGINLQRAGSVWRAGAASAAVISDLYRGAEPSRQILKYLQRSRELML